MITEKMWRSWQQRIAEIVLEIDPIVKKEARFENLDLPFTPQEETVLKTLCAKNQDLLLALIQAYKNGSKEERDQIRSLFAENEAFSWAIQYKMSEDSEKELENYFVFLSILDQWPDTRDFLLIIRDIIAQAKQNKINYQQILQEVAALSSTINRYGWGSTREILLNEGNK